MKQKSIIMFALAAAAPLAGWVWADDPITAVSSEVSLDTRAVSSVTAMADQDLETRSYTDARSMPIKLSTKKIKGTIFLVH